ncbi:MAG: helix-turn-helix domain-containing protein [Candidatus Limiplasma sp.]|nr:helix-turn-helix domain-containing protein [Candidatus Limiplasma sp.]
MTKDQKVEAYKMVLDGHSFQDIAKTFGTSRQQIYNLFGKGRRRKVNCI